MDRFQITARLGSGGFGTVFRAWDGRLERDVAIKVIECEGDTGERVEREARAAARLNHPGIVTLYEFGELDNQAFLVSELVDGETLKRLTLESRLSDRDVAEVGIDLCEALDHAHSRGVIHRDIKPQNILLPAAEPQAKLMDFGIARVLDASSLTSPGDVVGTLAYMAPEQADGLEAGPPADVYALGLTLYECWAGENPHIRSNPAATARSIGTRPPSLAKIRRDLPRELCEDIDACLCRMPSDRPTIEELGCALEAHLAELDDTVPEQRRLGAGIAGVIAGGLGDRDVPGVAAAAAVTGLTIAAMAAMGPGPLALWLAIPLITVVSLLRPRIGYMGGALWLAVWQALVIGRPGAGALLGILALSPALLSRSEGRLLAIPLAAPALGAFALAPIFPAIAALGESARERFILGASGFAWLAVAEVVMHRTLLFGPAIPTQHGWQESVGGGTFSVLGALLVNPATLLMLFSWGAASVIAGAILAPLRAWYLRRPPAERLGRPQPASPLLRGGGRQASLP